MKLKENFPGQPEFTVSTDPGFKWANEDHDKKIKEAEEAMKANQEAVDLVSGDETKKKEGKVKNDALKKMHLSEDLFTDVFKPFNESMMNEELSILAMKKDIEKAKAKLKNQARKNGVVENFGEEDCRKIGDKYFKLSTDENRSDYYKLLNNFTNWCANYTPLDESLEDGLVIYCHIPWSFAVSESLKEETKRPFDLEELAQKLDDFMYDFDTYDYNDAYETREEGFKNALDGLRDNPKYVIDMLKEILDENRGDGPTKAGANVLLAEIKQYMKDNLASKMKAVADKQNIKEELLSERFADLTYNEKSKLASDIANKIIDEYSTKESWLELYNVEVDAPYITIKFLIENGDWKHDHLAFQWWMSQHAEDISDCLVKYGGNTVVDDNGSDTYSAIHTYFFIPKDTGVEETEEPENEEEQEDIDLGESLKFKIAHEQIKRFNEGKMPKNWFPSIYLENLEKRKHITAEEKKILEGIVNE